LFEKGEKVTKTNEGKEINNIQMKKDSIFSTILPITTTSGGGQQTITH